MTLTLGLQKPTFIQPQKPLGVWLTESKVEVRSLINDLSKAFRQPREENNRKSKRKIKEQNKCLFVFAGRRLLCPKTEKWLFFLYIKAFCLCFHLMSKDVPYVSWKVLCLAIQTLIIHFSVLFLLERNFLQHNRAFNALIEQQWRQWTGVTWKYLYKRTVSYL